MLIELELVLMELELELCVLCELDELVDKSSHETIENSPSSEVIGVMSEAMVAKLR